MVDVLHDHGDNAVIGVAEAVSLVARDVAAILEPTDFWSWMTGDAAFEALGAADHGVSVGRHGVGPG